MPEAPSPPVRLWRPLAAALYDGLLVLALLMIVTALAMAFVGDDALDPTDFRFRGLLLAAWWLYFAASWTRGGRTIGMRAWRLVLTDRDGGAVGWWPATLRFSVAWVSALAAGLGFLWTLVDREGLSWHDRASGTRLKLQAVSADAAQPAP